MNKTSFYTVLGFCLLSNFAVSAPSKQSKEMQKKLVVSMYKCDLHEVNKLLDNGVHPDFKIKSKIYTNGMTPYQFAKYIPCKDDSKYYSNQAEGYKKYRTDMANLLLRHGAKEDQKLWNLTYPGENTPNEKKLFTAIKECNENEIKRLIQSGVNPNVRNKHDRDKWYEGMTPFAIAAASVCGRPDLSSKKKYNKFIIRKKRLLNLMKSLNADMNMMVPIYSMFYPAFRTAFYNDLGSGYGTEMVTHAISLGANPNALNSFGSNTLSDHAREHGTYEEMMKLINAGVRFDIVDTAGFDQSALLPNLSFTNKQNVTLMNKYTNDFRKFNRDNPYNNPIFRVFSDNTWKYKNGEKSLSNMNSDISIYISKYPQMINEWAGNKKEVLLMSQMISLCPVTQYNGQRYFSFKSNYSYENENTELMSRKASLYKWFLKFIKKTNFDPNITDKNKNTILDYAIQNCPFEIVKALDSKGAIFGTSTHKNEQDAFTELSKSKYADTVIQKLPFNNDERNFEYYSGKKNLKDISSLKSSDITNPLLLSSINKYHKNYIRWESIANYGININGQIDVSGYFEMNYSEYKQTSKIEIPIAQLSEGKTFSYSNPIIKVDNVKNQSSSYQSFNLGKGVKTIKVKSIYKDRINLEFFDGDIGTYISTMYLEDGHKNEYKLRIKYATSKTKQTKQMNELIKFKLSRSGYDHIIKLSDFGYNWPEREYLSVQKNFRCTSKYCDLLETEKLKNGALKVSLNKEVLAHENSIRSYIWNFVSSDYQAKKEILHFIYEKSIVEHTPFLKDFLYTNITNVDEEDINRLILKTLIRIKASTGAEFDWDSLVDKLQAIEFLTNDGSANKDLFIYICKGGDTSKLIMSLFKSQIAMESFLTIINETRHDEFLRDKYKTLITQMIISLEKNEIENNLSNEVISHLRDFGADIL